MLALSSRSARSASPCPRMVAARRLVPSEEPPLIQEAEGADQGPGVSSPQKGHDVANAQQTVGTSSASLLSLQGVPRSKGPEGGRSPEKTGQEGNGKEDEKTKQRNAVQDPPNKKSTAEQGKDVTPGPSNGKRDQQASNADTRGATGAEKPKRSKPTTTPTTSGSAQGRRPRILMHVQPLDTNELQQ